MTELAYEDIKTGDEASLSVTITETHIVIYAGLTGDVNPVHVDAEHAKESMFGERIAHGMLVSGLISAVLGPGCQGRILSTSARTSSSRLPLKSAIPSRSW